MNDVRCNIDPQQYGNVKINLDIHNPTDMLDFVHRDIGKGGVSVNLCIFNIG